MVTGLGTPVANRLVPDLVAYQQSGDIEYHDAHLRQLAAASYDSAASAAANALGAANVFDALTITASVPLSVDAAADSPLTTADYADASIAVADGTQHVIVNRPAACDPAALDVVFGSGGLFQDTNSSSGNDGQRSASLAQYFGEGPQSPRIAADIFGQSGEWGRRGVATAETTPLTSESLVRSASDAFFGDLAQTSQPTSPAMWVAMLQGRVRMSNRRQPTGDSRPVIPPAL